MSRLSFCTFGRNIAKKMQILICDLLSGASQEVHDVTLTYFISAGLLSFDHLAKVVSTRFLHCSIIFFPL